jgi:hypothetical protein
MQFGKAVLGAGPPYQCQAVVVQGLSGFDWSTVTSAYFQVAYPNGLTAQWPATLTNQSTAGATLTHVYVAGTDLPYLGLTEATPIGVVASPAGNLIGETIQITVVKYL